MEWGEEEDKMELKMTGQVFLFPFQIILHSKGSNVENGGFEKWEGSQKEKCVESRSGCWMNDRPFLFFYFSIVSRRNELFSEMNSILFFRWMSQVTGSFWEIVHLLAHNFLGFQVQDIMKNFKIKVFKAKCDERI